MANCEKNKRCMTNCRNCPNNITMLRINRLAIPWYSGSNFLTRLYPHSGIPSIALVSEAYSWIGTHKLVLINLPWKMSIHKHLNFWPFGSYVSVNIAALNATTASTTKHCGRMSVKVFHRRSYESNAHPKVHCRPATAEPLGALQQDSCWFWEHWFPEELVVGEVEGVVDVSGQPRGAAWGAAKAVAAKRKARV